MILIVRESYPYIEIVSFNFISTFISTEHCITNLLTLNIYCVNNTQHLGFQIKLISFSIQNSFFIPTMFLSILNKIIHLVIFFNFNN
jgi:hypothetical protein